MKFADICWRHESWVWVHCLNLDLRDFRYLFMMYCTSKTMLACGGVSALIILSSCEQGSSVWCFLFRHLFLTLYACVIALLDMPLESDKGSGTRRWKRNHCNVRYNGRVAQRSLSDSGGRMPCKEKKRELLQTKAEETRIEFTTRSYLCWKECVQRGCRWQSGKIFLCWWVECQCDQLSPHS